MNPIILIPARMASTRLPGKPLADIGGAPMIVQVARRAQASGVGRVVVACDGEEIAERVRAHGFEAVLTDPDLPSGSDRIYAALREVDGAGKHDIILNVQGDMPTLEPSIVASAAALLANGAVDIGTLAAPITDAAEITDPAVVKIARAVSGQALYFSRSPIPHGAHTYYHHIGIYAYRRSALERFVALPPSPLEQTEKLEQLRALEAGMRIDVAIVDTVPLGVDTPETLEKAKAYYGKNT
jgi:3-deoxy-manno-octulosonate cytidylyltransferase (CMP-KDO synthetase)